MNDENPRIKKIMELVDILLKKAEEKRKGIVSEIRATDECLKDLNAKRKKYTRHG